MLCFVQKLLRNTRFTTKIAETTCVARMSMKAVVLHEYGDSSKLMYEDVPIPDIGSEEVR